MAIINVSTSQTEAQKAARRIRESALRLHSLMLASHQEIFTTLWNTANVTPQAILDVLGTDSTQLFTAGGKAVEILLAQNASALTLAQYTPPQTPTFNQDGTVTLAP